MVVRVRDRKVNEIFDDLDRYRAWCVEFGYVFDEADLYRHRSSWNLYQRHRHGDKGVPNQWVQATMPYYKNKAPNR